MYKRASAAVVALAAITLTVTGCSSSGSSASKSSSSSPMTETTTSSSAAAAAQPFGSACSAVPATGAGSFNGMATDPVATAASNNPVLSTLVTAVKAAGLVDTLNSQQALTVFAPYNGAFSKIPSATLNSVLANKTQLTSILTYHVLAGRLSPDQLAGTHKTLNGASVTVAGSGQTFTVGPKGTEANVICGNVQTANATVYIIDSVMMPPASS